MKITRANSILGIVRLRSQRVFNFFLHLPQYKLSTLVEELNFGTSQEADIRRVPLSNNNIQI